VFARTLGMPNDPVAAVRQLAAGIASRAMEPIGLGKVNGRYFCFHTGVGYDAAVVREVERRASLKRWLGHPLFIYAALRTWMVGYDRHAPHFSVAAPGAAPVPGYFTVVLNTNPYTYLGNRPLDLSPAATLDRGLVAITFQSLNIGALLGGLGGALKGGGVQASATLDVHTDLGALTIAHDTPFPYQLDGDYLGETRHLEFQHVPEAVRLVRPQAD
jgi:diacylglycerol kinase family enzyme